MASLQQIGPDLPARARRAIAAHLRGERPDAEGLGPAAPVFVTLRDAAGQLRGCIGTLAASEPTVAEETARNAVLAATRDPRFPPVAEGELDQLSIEVSVLLAEEPVADTSQLDPKRFGVIVRDAAGHRGVLLPDVPGVESAEQQLAIARRKAGVGPDDQVQLARFGVLKFCE